MDLYLNPSKSVTLQAVGNVGVTVVGEYMAWLSKGVFAAFSKLAPSPLSRRLAVCTSAYAPEVAVSSTPKAPMLHEVPTSGENSPSG